MAEQFEPTLHRRETDVEIKTFWFSYTGNGKLLATLVVAVGLLTVSIGAVVGLYFHDRHQLEIHGKMIEAAQAEHETLRLAIADQTKAIQDYTHSNDIQTCVISLTEKERVLFRTQGKYCPGRDRLEVRGAMK